jgi:hypothetical protein
MALGMQYDFDRLERAFMRDRALPVAIARRWVCLSTPRERVTLRDLLREPYTTRFTKRPLT